MTYLTVHNQEVSLLLFLPTVAKINFKLYTRGLLILLLQIHSRLTPICKDELKN